MIERILSAASYFTAGGVGFVWLIIAALIKKTVTPFLMYHILQSIFISIGFFIITKLFEFIWIIIYRIPYLNAIPYLFNFPLPFAFGLSIIQLFTSFIILYLGITSFMGLYSYLPYVSNIINGNIRR